jgi:hypothetical protein
VAAPPPLSLFEGDPFKRFLVWLRIDRINDVRPLRRVAAAISFTWLPVCALSWVSGHALGATPRESFLVDVAALFQFVVVVPLLLAAEPWLEARIQDAGKYLQQSAIIRKEDRDRYDAILWRIAAARGSWIPVAACVVCAYAMMASWLLGELRNGYSTWHAVVTGPSERLTLPGTWAAFLAIPFALFTICRWVWKVILWACCLRELSRLRLRILPAHPDAMGGLGFLGTLQGRFGTIIFAVGVLIAATTYHKVVTEEAALGTWATWAPPVAYIVLAPLAFAAPLLFFARPMAAAKRNAERRYATLLVELSGEFHRRWLGEDSYSSSLKQDGPDFSTMADAAATLHVVNGMRIVPFDFRTIANLALSAGVPMIPVFAKLLPIPEPLQKVIETFT